MDLMSSKRWVDWSAEADDMFHGMLSEACDLIARAELLPMGAARNELMRRWALLSDSAHHVARMAVEVSEKIGINARACLGEEHRAQ